MKKTDLFNKDATPREDKNFMQNVIYVPDYQYIKNGISRNFSTGHVGYTNQKTAIEDIAKTQKCITPKAKITVSSNTIHITNRQNKYYDELKITLREILMADIQQN